MVKSTALYVVVSVFLFLELVLLSKIIPKITRCLMVAQVSLMMPSFHSLGIAIQSCVPEGGLEVDEM